MPALDTTGVTPPAPDPVLAAIALGANLGDRESNLRFAVRRLRDAPGVSDVVMSGVIQTPALTLPGAAPQPDYLNAAATLRTTLSSRELLDLLLGIEREAGRDRSTEPRWGARVLDLDLLLFGERVIEEEGLTVPHPRLHERDFVLRPLAEIAPELRHPRLKASVRELLDRLPPGDSMA